MSVKQGNFDVPPNSTLYIDDAESAVNLQEAYWKRLIADRVKEQIDWAYVKKANEEEPFRNHLGASIIGGECLRRMYYHFNWFAREDHHARMHRIFDRGHKVESEIRAILRSQGCQFLDKVDETGEQVICRDKTGHFGGSTDGVILWPEVGIVKPMGLECKSSKTGADFNKLVNHEATMSQVKPQHYAQVNVYGEYLQLDHYLYVCKNKNDESIYCEVVEVEHEKAKEQEQKAFYIITTEEVPAPVSKRKDYWLCKSCEYWPICKDDQKPMERNCRNCKNCKAANDGQFACTLYNNIIPKDFLIKGCDNHYYKKF